MEKRYAWSLLLATVGGWTLGGELAQAAEVRVAVASNFSTAAREIETAFESATGHDVKLVFGSTGKHYAQILNGAPIDVLLAADAWRPKLLEEESLAVPESRFTYARGRLVLWSPEPERVDPEGDVLRAGSFRYLSIANPKLAPYGAAAQEVLEVLGLWERLQKRIVRGENIAQAFQFVDSGNAELGFIAASQLSVARRARGSWWDVPENLYSPIDQQAVLLKDAPAAREFLAFLGSHESLEIIRHNGYEIP